ncbi:MAG TPA: DUF2807 domain-containing protein [Rhizomicrobium sp.]|jgi:hypothetical protein
MTQNWTSIFGDAAVATLLILPSFGSMGPAEAGGPPTPPAPPAPPAPMVHVAPAGQGGDWSSWAPRNYNTRGLRVDDFVGTVLVNVRDGGPMTVEAWGARERLKGLHVSQDDGRLEIKGSQLYDSQSVWDWKHWFDFSNLTEETSRNLTVRITVPRGTDVDIESLVGNATIGDTQGTLRLDAAATKAVIGHIASADIEVGGSGRIDIASVTGTLKLDVGGSGKITVGSVGNVKADIAGSGDARIGAIAGGLDIDIAGSGDVVAARVNGPTRVDIAGSGSVKIADGTADPLHVQIMGAGNFNFGGVAINPHIEAFGSGNVHIKSYRGHMDSEGMADVKIGD